MLSWEINLARVGIRSPEWYACVPYRGWRTCWSGRGGWPSTRVCSRWGRCCLAYGCLGEAFSGVGCGLGVGCCCSFVRYAGMLAILVGVGSVLWGLLMLLKSFPSISFCWLLRVQSDMIPYVIGMGCSWLSLAVSTPWALVQSFWKTLSWVEVRACWKSGCGI